MSYGNLEFHLECYENTSKHFERNETQMCIYNMEDIKQEIPGYHITYDSTCSKILSQSREDEELKRDMSAISWEHGRIAGGVESG